MYSPNIHCLGFSRARLAGLLTAVIALTAVAVRADEVFGPENLNKTMRTPFNSSERRDSKSVSARLADDDSIDAIQLNTPVGGARRIFAERLTIGPRMFLPDRMILGKSADFLIKAPAGSKVAIAMADKDKGAKPVFGQAIRLGSDRKQVTVGTVPESGILNVAIETPIQGDLIGSQLFFEALIWTKPDFSDLKVATCITPHHTGSEQNGVVITPDIEPKKQGLFTLDSGHSLSGSQSTDNSVFTGRP